MVQVVIWRYRETAGWRHVHRAKVFATDLYSDSDACAQAVIDCKQLSTLKSEEAKECTEKFNEIFKGVDLSSKDAASGLDIKMVKSLTKSGRELYFSERDDYFESLANIQNRAVSLVIISILIVVVLGATYGQVMLFILGAVGGLLSRMRSIMRSKDEAFDYGATWSSLFLSPVVGALPAWVGVLLVVVAAYVGMADQFPKAVGAVKFYDIEVTKKIAAMAVVFGFSATLFENLIEKVEGKIKGGINFTKQDRVIAQ